MRISVRAKPGASSELVEEIGENEFRVWVKEPPVKGLANIAIGNALAVYFKVPKSQVRLISGYKSPNKVFEIA